MKKLILASASPRRSEILRAAGIRFEVRPTDTDESVPAGTPTSEAGCIIAGRKCRAAATAAERPAAGDEIYILAADTAVECYGETLGKPHDRDEAVGMLHRLSGAEHFVTTGVTLRTVQRRYSFAVTTAVRFRALADEEIAYYVDRFRPFDKAGGYGIQEWIGYVAIESINGSFYNVMGLPCLLYTSPSPRD